jgi:hypothetical protein
MIWSLSRVLFCRNSTNMKQPRLKIALFCLIPVIGIAVLLWILPVPVTILDQPADSAMRPYGEITKANPVEECLPSEAFPQQTSLEIKLATYARNNTAHYQLEWYGVTDDHQKILSQEDLKTNEIADNQFVNFPMPKPMNTPGETCFRLVTNDATPGNAITVWLNAQNDPVLRLKTWMPLKDALARVGETNLFGLGKWPFIALFCICPIALLAFVAFLFLTHEEKDRDANIPHHQGARPKRV